MYGVTGSGKTTLAARLAQQTGLPWHSVDDLTWQPGWVEVPVDEQRRRIAAICAGQRWILDTAYSRWLDLVLPRVELIVALDYPRWLSLGRLVRRSVMRALDHRRICNGNTESFRQLVSHDSIVVWHFRSFSRKRARINEWAADESCRHLCALPRHPRRGVGKGRLPGEPMPAKAAKPARHIRAGAVPEIENAHSLRLAACEVAILSRAPQRPYAFLTVVLPSRRRR